jgi:uncharacterized protein (TIGR02284 family)
MNQDKREPDLSTNVPKGAEPETGHTDIEREERGRDNVPIERDREDRAQIEGSIERAKERLGHAGKDIRAAANEGAHVARAVAHEGVTAARNAAENAKAALVSEDEPTTKRTGEPTKSSTVERLNDLLRGELASVETYELALKSVRDAELTSSLRQIRDSHERRVTLLSAKVRELGGEPSESSGVWGAFARIVQRGADLLGHRAAIAALEEGEDQGKRRYSRDLDELEESMRTFVLTELAPEQRRTHDLAQSLQKFVKAA